METVYDVDVAGGNRNGFGGRHAVLRWQRRGLHRWIVPYLMQTGKRRLPRGDEDVHLILCVADHFEPKGGQATPERAWARVNRWVCEYPRQLGGFRDSDGRPPRHTFFYPIEEYEAAHVDALAKLCQAGFGEVEIHLHHEGDDAHHLRQQLLQFKEILGQRHGLLARHKETGELAYGFIHGNWALCNARPDGRCCGVAEELDILRETGCYADFTMPSAPHVTQTRKINSLYYAVNRPGRPRSHNTGIDVGSRPRRLTVCSCSKVRSFMTGGSANGECCRSWRMAACRAVNLQRRRALQNWLRARVQVPSRPDWLFVKLHAHGAEEMSYDALLGQPMVRFHRELAEHTVRNPRFHYHYVTAREMYNLVKAAEAGWKGTIAKALDFELVWNGCTSQVCAPTPSGTKWQARNLDRTALGDIGLGMADIARPRRPECRLNVFAQKLV